MRETKGGEKQKILTVCFRPYPNVQIKCFLYLCSFVCGMWCMSNRESESISQTNVHRMKSINATETMKNEREMNVFRFKCDENDEQTIRQSQ